MTRVLRFALFCLSLVMFAGIAHAQVGAKAYAPEDLRRLEVRDRVRVIEREYSEQSGGRRIPDDQLEFYLDQIDSGWSFSRIKQDIAESLGGGGRGRPWAPPVADWRAREVICSSVNERYNECPKPFRGAAVLSEQFSAVRCIEGSTWGQRRDVIWVDRGCRGRFREDVRARPVASDVVVCESREGRRRRCALPFDGPVQIVEQYSNAPCIEGQTWGWRPGEVWVNRGCRAAFAVVPGRGVPPGRGLPTTGRPGFDYSVTCASEDGRYRTCAWDDRAGRPYLIEQFSSSPCIEGRSWGYTREGLWVDRGCRGRFGAR